MTPPLEYLPLIAVLLPLLCALLIPFAHRHPNLRETITLLTGVVLFATVLRLLTPVAAGARPVLHLTEPVPGLELGFQVEPLGLSFALLASFLWIITSIYSIGYMRGHQDRHQTRFYAWFAVAISAAMGIAFANNLFTLFLFYEALTLFTWPLVTHHRDAKARHGGRIYVAYLFSSSIGLLLLAVVGIWAMTGDLTFRPGGVFVGHPVSDTLLAVLYGLFAFGIGKAALMPFHRWLPAAMVAPAPVSALLHAVAVVKAGVFSLIKVTVYIFGLDTLQDSGASQWLLPVAAFTIVVASLIAMTKDNLKARLAYSTISQLSYIVLGAMLANVWGILAAALHMLMHAFGKITLFFAAGAIQVASHKTEISEMDGLGRHMPVTLGLFALGALAIIGLPPLGAMWSKWYLFRASMDAEHWLLLGVLGVSTLLNIAYLLPIPLRAFFAAEKPADTEHHHPPGEAPRACLLAMGVTAAGCLLLFAAAPVLLDFLRPIVEPGSG